MINRKCACVAAALLLAGCTLAEVKVEVVGERTALENQVLGTYQSLDREMLLLASVRGVDSQGQIRKPPPQSREHKDVVSAMQVQAFNADDIQIFKRLGWVGENRAGLLTPFSMDFARVPDELREAAAVYKPEEFTAVVNQVNEARMVVMRRVIEMNERLSAADLPRIQEIFGKLNAESALPGEKVQLQDGSWKIKP